MNISSDMGGILNIRLLNYFLRIWIPEFAKAWIAEKRPDDDEQDWLEAAMIQTADKYTVLQERSMANYRNSNTVIVDFALIFGVGFITGAAIMYWFIDAGIWWWL